MATVTGLTAERMLEIEAASVVDGDVVGNDLILARKDGSIINAGNVRGGPGPTGPMGEALDVVTAQPVLDVGIVNQIRAGRPLTPADFTNMGLSVPLGLWNLSNFNDSSGNARHLTNKGSVPLAPGIMGTAATAAQFVGSTGQVLYIADTGLATDPFRINSGSVGCWMRTAKRGVNQYMISKMAISGSGSANWFSIMVDSTNVLSPSRGGYPIPLGFIDIADDRWHFVVMTWDGTFMRQYTDGVPDGMRVAATNSVGVTSGGPLNIGGYGMDGTVGAMNVPAAHYGRVDEAFVLGDVLTDEQVRNLYCASVPHALGGVPSSFNLGIRRRRRGAPLAVTDFPSQPLRLYNMINGALTDQGSQNQILTNPGVVPMAGPDGSPNGSYRFGGAGGNGLQAPDATLPLGTATRSYGGWFKTRSNTIQTIISWGNQTTPASSDIRLQIINNLVRSLNGGDNVTSIKGWAADGSWQFVTVVYDNSAADGLRHKLYLNARLVGSSPLAGNPIVSGGALGFRIGVESLSPNNPMTGEISRVFVHNIALTQEQIRHLYDVGPQLLAPSPKNPYDHIEAIEGARLLATFDAIESSDLIDLAVAS